jgi:hypothetical protein
MKLEFCWQVFEKYSPSNSTEHPPVGADLFHADGKTDRHDDANNRFSQFCESASKSLRNVRKVYWLPWDVEVKFSAFGI